MFSRGPFGRGAIDLTTLEELVREPVSPGGKLSLKQPGCALEATADSDEACEKLLEAKEELQRLLEQQGVFHHLMVARDLIVENSARASATSDAAEMW